jgi:membrane protease YdiL (CAAX protease family)
VAAEPPTTAAAGMHPLLKVIIAYSVMLVVSLVWGLMSHAAGHLDENERMAGVLVLEALDTVVVLITAVAVGRLRVPKPAAGIRIVAWLTAPVAFAAVLAVNVAYRQWLIEFLRAQWLKELLAEPEWSMLTALLFAVQPALIEEWFFRHLALGAVRTVTGVHAAVWVSAVMFAMAHVYNPLGLPWLLVGGIVFGYWRVMSGGLAVPILLHLSLNATILWFQGLL